MAIILSMDRRPVFFIIFNNNFFNKSFNYKMTNLSYSGDNNFSSEENIKVNIIKILIIYLTLSIIILTFLNLSGLRLFNSLNLSMSLVSGEFFTN